MKSTKKFKMFRLKPEVKHGVTIFRLQVKVKQTLINLWSNTLIVYYDSQRAEKRIKDLNKRFSKVKNKQHEIHT